MGTAQSNHAVEEEEPASETRWVEERDQMCDGVDGLT